MVLNLYTSTDNALYLYQISRKYFIVSQLLSRCHLHIETYKGIYLSKKCRWSYDTYFVHIAW